MNQSRARTWSSMDNNTQLYAHICPTWPTFVWLPYKSAPSWRAPHGVYQTVNLPTNVAHHYISHPVAHEPGFRKFVEYVKEYGLPDDPDEPFELYVDGTHATLGNGNHRAEIAKRLGIPYLPVQIIATGYPIADIGRPLERYMLEWVQRQPRDWMKHAI